VGRLEDHVAGLEQRRARLDEEAADLPDPEELQHLGDLILARFHEIPQGEEAVRLTDFDGSPVHVELDPMLPPDGNARRYYDRAARVRRARERLPRLRAEARAAWREGEALLERVRAGEAAPDQVEAYLPPAPSGDDGGDDAPTLPYRVYRSSGGLEIRVGRGAKRNDDLTFRHSNPDDIWLHARHTAGAHVILRWNRDANPPNRDLHEAGVLAALASKARTSGSVPVDWTRRKYVRKPRKAPPGAVVPDRVQTVFVAPDAALEERLRAE
jgi:predicted ribosome quality control (RQC) complex YloA/Tae2 family protein